MKYEKKNDTTSIIFDPVSYVFGRVEVEIEGFARSMAIPASVLAERVGALLLGQGTGVEHNLPALRSGTRKKRATVAKVEVARRPYRRTQKRKGTAKTPGIQKYWDAMSPEQRRAEMARRRASGQGRKAA